MKESNNKPPLKKNQAQKPASEFVCLRHPTIRKDKPGVCPKCGTSLRLKNK